MSKKPRGLGAGFSALISQRSNVVAQVTQDRLMNLSVDQLVSGQFQPRSQWDDESLQALSESIRSQGIVQPLIVRALTAQQYEIIAGERRWRAAKLAGLTEVPVVLKQLDDQASMAMALIENIQREDLSAIEEARAIKKLVESFGLTHEQIAQTLGRSRESISNLLRLLKLSLSVQSAVLDGALSAGHARALLPLGDSEQQRLAQQSMSQQWSVRTLEQVVKSVLEAEQQQNKPVKTEAIDSNYQLWQDQVSQKMGRQVALKMSASGKGKIEILFENQQDLQSFIDSF
jgi:ParB family chromosome partitioning protein